MRRVVVWLAMAVLLAGCQVGGSGKADKVPSGTPVSTKADPRGHKPGARDVSTMTKGKEFRATPNFYYGESCGRPCWLRVYPKPTSERGGSVTDHYPFERFADRFWDSVHVACQVRGQEVYTDGRKFRSALWDKIIVARERVVQGQDKLRRVPGSTSYYAYAPDLWLGNTGDHGIPCKK